MNSLFISDELIFLAVNEHTGKFLKKFKSWMGLKLAAAILMDLVLHGKINIIGNKVQIIDKSSTNDIYLDECLNILKKLKNNKKVTYYLWKFSSKFKDLLILLLHRLEYNNYTEPVEKIGRTLNSITIIILKPEVKITILEKLTDILINNEVPDEHYIFLISLLRVGKMYKHLFNSTLHKQIRSCMTPIIEHERIGKEVRREILAIFLR